VYCWLLLAAAADGEMLLLPSLPSTDGCCAVEESEAAAGEGVKGFRTGSGTTQLAASSAPEAESTARFFPIPKS
jgi:hypothetical protein